MATTDTLATKTEALLEAQPNAHVKYNHATRWLRAASPNYVVISTTLNAPPGSPSDDDLYIVGGTPTGDWAGEAGSFALYNSDGWGTSGWDFKAPEDGDTRWNIGLTPEKLQIYDADGAAWRDVYTSTA